MTPQQGREPLRRWDPERIGPYVILGRLGAGSMGEVFLGRSASGRLVAVKTIRPGLAEEAGFRTRFAQEVAAARKVSGVFTAAVVEADPDADLPWLATAYVPAPSLARLVKACGPMPVAAVRWLAAGCAEALESIHAAGLVHRDLKPSNVLVAPDGPKVIDFGVARAAERIALTTARGAIGTPAYMAPEQARDTKQASVASDVYSLGATLVFAATGHPPYAGDVVMDVLARLATEPPDLSGLPAGLADLVGACLQRVPSARPTSSQVLATLGPFTEAATAVEHSYLPEAARALIAEYQRTPLPAGGGPDVDDRSDEATNASGPGLPASFLPKPRTPGPLRRVFLAHAWAGPRWLPASSRRWIRTHLGWAGWASVGAALVAVGVILGASLTSSGDQPGPPPNGAPPAPPTVCGRGTPVAGITVPTVCMVRTSQGALTSDFVVEAVGFEPETQVTVNLTEIGLPPAQPQVLDVTSQVKPVTGADGTVTFPVMKVYPDQLQLGLVTVTITGTGGREASTTLMVIPSG
ncbi:MAG: serine/threonine-protein kinase [Streptosporangiaceae bacterium]